MESTNPLGVWFNMMKIRFQSYDQILTSLDYLQQTDKVSIFINFETVLKYLCMTQDLERKMMVSPDIDKILVSETINLAAHYKDFFRGNRLDTKIFIYMTSLESEMGDFEESKYNEDYRSYYLNKYVSNPKFALLGTKLKDVILPEVKMICDYIPNVYFIQLRGVDSGVIPKIIADLYPDRKNIVISGDLQDTQYDRYGNFLDHLYIRTYGTNIVASTKKDYLKAIMKADEIPPVITDTFKNSAFYNLLLACIGDKYRSIDGIQGIKLKKLIGLINDGLTGNQITETTSSVPLLSDIFPPEYREAVYQNMSSIDIDTRIQGLGSGVIKNLQLQVVDKMDVASLMKLNQGPLSKHPLLLEALLK